MPVPPRGGVGRDSSEGLFEAESEMSLAGDADLFALGEDLHSRADGSSLPSSGDGADGSAAAGLLGAIGAAGLARNVVVAGEDGVDLLVDKNADELEAELRFAGDAAGFFDFGEATIDIGALGGDKGFADVEVSSRLARKRSPTEFLSQSTPSIMRTRMEVPAGTVTMPGAV